MSSTTTSADPSRAATSDAAARTAIGTATTLARTAAAEWTRIWSVRSSWAFAGATALAVLGIGALVGIDASGDPSVAQEPGASAWDGSRPTSMFALFGVLALAVVTTTADHGTRGIVPTLQWTPRRGVLLAARSGVVVATTTALGVLLVCLATLVVWVFVPEVGILEPEGARSVADLALVLSCGAGLAAGHRLR